MPKRKDATYVYDIQPFKKLFPYLMPRKCDSLVYISLDLDLTKTLEFIKHNPSTSLNRKYRVFEVLIAAFVRLFILRPELNRFIMNKRIWQRNDISLNFIVKEKYDDNSPEHSIILNFDNKSTLDNIANLVDNRIQESRNAIDAANNNAADKLVNIFTSFPPIILSSIVSFLKFLDIKGLAPLSITNEDGLHCSAYLSNLGSIGLNNGVVHHHLYQWGTTSIFLTIGGLKRKRIHKDDKILKSDKLELGFTLDERIADGYYFVQSLNKLQEIMNHPEELLFPPINIKARPAKNKREYKKKRKQNKEIS